MKKVVVVVLVLIVLASVAMREQGTPTTATCGTVSGGSTMTAAGIGWAQKLGNWVRDVATHPVEHRNPLTIQQTVDGVQTVLWAWLRTLYLSLKGSKIDPQILLLQQQAEAGAAQARAACTAPCPPGPGGQQAPDPASFTTHPSGLKGAALATAAARAAGFPESQIPMAVTVAKYESGWNPRAVNNWKPTAHMRGMWQIYQEVHRDLMRLGDWRDPYVNARMAYRVWKAAGGSWSPWSTAATARRNLIAVPAGRAPLSDSITPPPPSPDCTAAGSSSTLGSTTGSVRSVKDVTSGTVYRVPIPAGPRGVALNFALDQEAQGDWYRFGAQGPNLWDCSGLVSKAWKKAGFTVYPQTEVMVRQETHVTKAEPGDIFYHPGHSQLFVGIIDGRTMIVEAPHTGERVRLRQQWMKPTAILDPMKSGANA